MKIRYKVIFTILIVLIKFNDLYASIPEAFIPDTANQIVTSNHIGNIKEKPSIYLNISTGLLINNSIGIHPLVNGSIGFRKSKNRFNLVYEYRFGHSDKYYQISDNDTLKSVNNYNGNYIGFEYQRLILNNANHELYTSTGIGTDWIYISKNETIKVAKIIGGLALNIGFGYTFYIKKKYGPNVELLYHYADFNNNKGSKIDVNSFLIRLSYNFRNDYNQK